MYRYCALPAASVSAWHTPTGATLRTRNARVIVARWRGANSPSAAAPCASAEQSSSPNDESIIGYGKPTDGLRISLFRIISAGPTSRYSTIVAAPRRQSSARATRCARRVATRSATAGRAALGAPPHALLALPRAAIDLGGGGGKAPRTSSGKTAPRKALVVSVVTGSRQNTSLVEDRRPKVWISRALPSASGAMADR